MDEKQKEIFVKFLEIQSKVILVNKKHKQELIKIVLNEEYDSKTKISNLIRNFLEFQLNDEFDSLNELLTFVKNTDASHMNFVVTMMDQIVKSSTIHHKTLSLIQTEINSDKLDDDKIYIITKLLM